MMTRKPEFLTKLLGAEVERSPAVTDECQRVPRKSDDCCLTAGLANLFPSATSCRPAN